MSKEMGERVTQIRKEFGMNKTQFAELLGISSQYLGKVEAGTHGLALDTLITLCEKTKTSADFFLFGHNTISYERLRELFVGIDKIQIEHAFKTLQFISFFIKDKMAKE